MWSKVNRLVALGAVLVVMAASGASADSADQAERRAAEARRWSFAVSLTGGFTFQNQYGTIDPTAEIISFPPLTKLPAPLRPPSDGRYPALNPYFGASAEIMTPAIEVLPGDPRIFANAMILPSFTSQGSTALEGAATEFIPPEDIVDNPPIWPQEAVGGVGSRLLAQVRTMVYSAGIGASFPLEVRKRLIRVKPFVSYLRYGVDIDGNLLALFKDDPDPAVTGAYGRNVRYIELSSSGTEYFNAIGPGLEIEMELPRVGSFRPSLYIEGVAYRVVGNQTIEIDDTVYVNDALGEAIYSASWRMDVADWTGRTGMGFRLRWVGSQ